MSLAKTILHVMRLTAFSSQLSEKILITDDATVQDSLTPTRFECARAKRSANKLTKPRTWITVSLFAVDIAVAFAEATN